MRKSDLLVRIGRGAGIRADCIVGAYYEMEVIPWHQGMTEDCRYFVVVLTTAGPIKVACDTQDLALDAVKEALSYVGDGNRTCIPVWEMDKTQAA